MTERPIIMTAESVRAILAGRKTQTRRIIRQADFSRGIHPGGLWADAVYPAAERGWVAWQGAWKPGPELEAFSKQTYRVGFPCPYGIAGDKLWVKEAGVWQKLIAHPEGHEIPAMAYRATYQGRGEPPYAPPFGERWRSPMFMPRWASRLTLRVTEVRVERLQGISDEDICHELGCPVAWPGPGPEPYPRQLRVAWANAWNDINAKRGYPWASNPWVWVVEFTKEAPDARP